MTFVRWVPPPHEARIPAERQKCRYCEMSIDPTNYGWVHSVSGGVCVQKCLDCGWKGSKPGGYFSCPDCHGLDLIDDHLAAP